MMKGSTLGAWVVELIREVIILIPLLGIVWICLMIGHVTLAYFFRWYDSIEISGGQLGIFGL